jgi:hypothetical protein
MCVLSMGLGSCHPSDAYIVEEALRFLENLCIPDVRYLII